MKRTERHRLKENEVALSVARAKDTFEVYRKPIIAGAVGIVAVAAIIVAVIVWRHQVDNKTRVLLAEAMTIAQAPLAPAPIPGQKPPAPVAGTYANEKARYEAALQKYLAAADARPSSSSGIAARYHAAATLALLERPADATKQYQVVVDRAGAGTLYADMAKLGMADVEAAIGQYDKAIALYTQLTTGQEARLPVDGVLMQLGRAYQEKGSATDARRAFQRIVDEFPQSPFAAPARRELEAIKG